MLHRIQILFIFLCQVFFISTSYAGYDDTARLNQLLRNIHTMQANFTQTVQDSRGRALKVSQGIIALQRPGQFRWQVIRPNEQLIIAKGNRLWVYDPDLKQVTVRSLSHEAGETPALLLSDANPALQRDFTVSSEQLFTGNLTWFSLIPKNKSSMIASMHLGFSGDQIQRMELHDHLGHTNIIQFQNIQTNVPLSPSLFSFRSPRNADVINQ